MNGSKNEETQKDRNKVTNQSGNTQADKRMKDFIKAAVNPDNNAFFAERSNHLSSKGD